MYKIRHNLPLNATEKNIQTKYRFPPMNEIIF